MVNSSASQDPLPEEEKLLFTLQESASGKRNDGPEKQRLFCSARLLILLLCCSGVGIYEATNLTMDFAWTCMVRLPNETATNGSLAIPLRGDQSPVEERWPGKLDWDKTAQTQLVLATQLAGLLFRAPAGFLLDRFGSYLIIGLGGCIIGVCTLAIPTLAWYGHYWVVGLRFVAAVAYGPIEPALYNVISLWVPGREAGFAMATTYSGFQLGPFFMLMLSGLQCDTIGWPWVFYCAGIAALLFGLTWLLVYTDGPEASRFASSREAAAILLTVAVMVMRRDRSGSRARSTPLRSLLRSWAVWAVVVGGVGSHYANLILRRYCPVYFSEILRFQPTENGVLSALPYLAQLVSRNTVGPVSDWLSEERRLGRTRSLKLFNSLSFIGAGLGFVGLALTHKETPAFVAVGLNIGTMFLLVFFTGGFQKSPLYIAPQHAGTIGAFTYTVAAAVTIGEAYYIGWQTSGYAQWEWRVVFVGGAVVCGLVAAFFLFAGSGRLQPWAQEDLRPAVLHEDPTKDTILDKPNKDIVRT